MPRRSASRGPGADPLAFCHLGRACEAGRDAIPIIPTLGDLAPHHLGWPGPRTDQAHVAAEDVQKLWHLIEVPGLEQPPAVQVRLSGSAS